MAIDECPNCGADLELDRYHSYHDYEMKFQTECPKCETPLSVEVETTPVFMVTEDKE